MDVVFIRVNTGGYFIYQGNNYLINELNIKNLQKSLNLPFTLKFYGFSRSQLGRIITDLYSLYNENVDVKRLYLLEKDSNNCSCIVRFDKTNNKTKKINKSLLD